MSEIFDTNNKPKARIKGLREHSFYIEGRPHPKERPRMAKSGHVYTPPKTLEAEKKIAEAYTGPMYDCPVHVNLFFDIDGCAVSIEPLDIPADEVSKLRGDLDNYAKTVMDALNGVAWIDDKQVMKLTAIKL